MATMHTFILLATIYLPATIKRELLLRFNGNNAHFYIVGNYIFASNNKKVTYCYVSIGNNAHFYIVGNYIFASNNKKGTYFDVYMATMHTFILLTTIYLPATIKRERIFTFL